MPASLQRLKATVQPTPPPQVPQLPFMQVPSAPPHAVAGGTHFPPAQQAPAVAQVSPAQQGCPSAPQAAEVPALQTVPLPVASPEATQLAVTQQPPPEH